MSLVSGSSLGSYEIISTLGVGGMGEVYRARDTRLGREVAVKVVLEAFLLDRERLVRFEREAKSLAALNHPNIATLFGMEESGGRHFLVMEFRAADGRCPRDCAREGHHPSRPQAGEREDHAG